MFAIAKTRGLLSRKVAALPCFQISIPVRTETFSPMKLVRADFATKSRRTVQAAYLKRREQKDQGPMLRHNEMIKHREVRLIGADGQQIGVVSLDEARAQARAAELDLVEVASGAKPPVCKLVNYSKYVYELQKAAQTKAKSAKPTKMKSMKFGIKIEPNDLDVKLRKILEFLEKQHAVRLVVSYIPRESWIAQEPKRREVMRTLLTRVVEAEAGFIERVIQVESFNMTATVYPLKAGHKKTPAELAGPLEQLDSPMQSKDLIEIMVQKGQIPAGSDGSADSMPEFKLSFGASDAAPLNAQKTQKPATRRKPSIFSGDETDDDFADSDIEHPHRRRRRRHKRPGADLPQGFFNT